MSPGGALAAHPLITDDADVQGTGHAQLEIYGSFSRDEDESGVTQNTVTANVTLTVGVDDRMDLVMGLPYVHTETSSPTGSVSVGGVSDASFELKVRLYKKDGLGFAFILGGLVYSPVENFDIDFGVLRGLAEGPDYSILAGITLRL